MKSTLLALTALALSTSSALAMSHGCAAGKTLEDGTLTIATGNGRRIKLRYAHQGGKNPPRIIIHGNQTESVPASYKRFLVGRFRKALQLQGSPLIVEFRTGENPYEGKKNKLTDRQVSKRRRLMQHVKKGKRKQ